jgi:hypothetical protein
MSTRRVRVTAIRRDSIDIERLVRLLIAQMRSMQSRRTIEPSTKRDDPDRGAA